MPSIQRPDLFTGCVLSSLPPTLKFFAWGLADFDGVAQFFPPENSQHISHSIVVRRQVDRPALILPVYRLASIVERLNLSRIDILKMDIEGAEYGVIEDLSRTQVGIKQLAGRVSSSV